MTPALTWISPKFLRCRWTPAAWAPAATTFPPCATLSARRDARLEKPHGRVFFPWLLLMRFENSTHGLGAVFAQLSVLRPKGGKKMAVNAQLPGDFAVHKDRHHDFGLGFERARQIARVFAHVVHDHGGSGRSRGPANPLIQPDARVRRHGAHKRPEDQDIRLVRVNHVKAHPVVFEHALVELLADALH